MRRNLASFSLGSILKKLNRIHVRINSEHNRSFPKPRVFWLSEYVYRRRYIKINPDGRIVGGLSRFVSSLIDFSFIRSIVAHEYCRTGFAYDPVSLFLLELFRYIEKYPNMKAFVDVLRDPIKGKHYRLYAGITANKIGNLRRYWKIPRFDPTLAPPEGELLTIKKAAEILGLAPSTLHRWLADGFIAGEQITPGAPWRIRMTDQLRSRFVEQPPQGYVSMLEATKMLGVSRQTVLQRVKRGDLSAVHVRCGKQKGLKIKVLDAQQKLFNNLP